MFIAYRAPYPKAPAGRHVPFVWIADCTLPYESDLSTPLNYFDSLISSWCDRRPKMNQALDADTEALIREMTHLSESVFMQIWDNSEDAVYDEL